MGQMDNVAVDTNVIPEYASVSESVYYVLESIEQDYSDMMQKFALAELGILARNNEEIVYEGSVLDSAKSKVTEFVTKSWAKTKAIFDKFLQDVKKNADKANAKIPTKKIKAKVFNTVGEISDQEYAKSYPYTGLEAEKKGNGKVCSALTAMINTDVNSSNCEDVKSKFAGAIGASSSSTRDIKNTIISYLHGGEKSTSINKASISSNIAEMWDCVFNYKVISAEIKKAYTASKAGFDAIAKKAK